MTEKYAVLQNGGKQYRLQEGQKVKLEYMDEEVGSKISFSEVMAVGFGGDIKIGAPVVESASVDVEILSHGRHDKINILKFKRRKHHMKRAGHRQSYTEVKVVSINH